MKNYFDLKGRVALVTGASSGLGVQFAKALANQGADVAIVARRVEKLEAVKKEIEAMGVKCLALKCDVTDTKEVASVVAQVKQHFGRLDILINNAGVGAAIPATEQTDEQWLHTVNVNLNAVYFMARECGKVMIEQGYGRIINIGSIHSTVAMMDSPITAYNATKGAVLMLTKSLANEWAKHGVTVNAIGPAYFPSEMTASIVENEAFVNGPVKAYCPMGRTGRDGELDTAILYFASDFSSYTTGQLIQVDGGWTTI